VQDFKGVIDFLGYKKIAILSAKTQRPLTRGLSFSGGGMGIRTLFDESTGEAGIEDAKRLSHLIRCRTKDQLRYRARNDGSGKLMPADRRLLR